MVDTLVKLLWRSGGAGTRALSLGELREKASRALRYEVPPSSVRSVVYAHRGVFERCRPNGSVAYRLKPGVLRGRR